MSDFTGDMTSAVESAFAAASTPDASTTTTVETPAPSATETATTDVSQAAATSTTQEPKEGPVPYQRFKEINEQYGTTKKELEALAWAKGLDPSLTQRFADLDARARVNPLVWTEELELVRDHPVLGPQLRSWAARTLGTRTPSRPTETVTEDTGPEPDIQFEDGRKAYSAEQQHKREQWLLSQVDQKITPLAERQNRDTAEKQIAAIRAKATVDAKTEIDSLKAQYPQFEEHRKDVAAVMEANPSFTLKQAWAEVFVNSVGPKLAGQHAATVIKKTQAGSANPARPSGAATDAPKDFAEALAAFYPART